MTSFNLTVAEATVYLFLASLKVRGRLSNLHRTLIAPPLSSSHHHFHARVSALLPARFLPRPAC